jgi:signal transduction histidine kinase
MGEHKVDIKLLDILNLDITIEKNLLQNVCFKDKNLEKLYKDRNPDNGIYDEGDKLVIIGWFSILFYVTNAFFRPQICALCLLFMTISFSLIRLKNMSHNLRTRMRFNYIQVFLFAIYLNFKIYYLNLKLKSEDDDNQREILRTVIFDFISSNLLCLLTLDENLTIRLSLLLINLSSISICILKSNQRNSYHIDALTSACYSFIFYMLKKAWEYNRRSTFSERYCLEKLLDYSNDFIRELNGLHFNRNKNQILISGRNIEDVFSDFIPGDQNPQFDYEDKVKSKLIADNNDNYKLFMKNLVEYDRKDFNSNDKQTESKTLLEKLDIVQHTDLVRNKFVNLGRFYDKHSLNLKYYEVFYRKYHLDAQVIDDIFFYDVTNFINAQEKIDEENSLRQKVFSKISNEFKTPVNSIISLIESIKDSINDDDKLTTIKYLDTVRNLSKYVIYLTNDIIQYSSNMNMNALVKAHKQPVYIREIVQFEFDVLECLLKSHNEKADKIKPLLYYDSTIDEVKISSDEVRIKQILLNFISNAVKFTISGKITINAIRDNNKKVIVISVTDTGVGINEENRKKLFEDFSQTSNTSVNNSFTSGLSICKSMASNLNIRMMSKSNYGNGSKFSIAIPFKEKRKIASSDKNSTEPRYQDLFSPNYLSQKLNYNVRVFNLNIEIK